MYKYTIIDFVFIICLFVVGSRCSEKTEQEKTLHAYEKGFNEYLQVLEEESQREETFDSLIFGVHFKMTQNMFYAYCHDMHLKGIFNGTSNYQVVVRLTEGFKRPVDLIFFPRFDKPFIEFLQARFGYASASAFNKDHGSGVLIEEVIREMMKWYGGRDFVKIPPQYSFGKPYYIKIDGNRKITLRENDSLTEVVAIYEDLKPLY